MMEKPISRRKLLAGGAGMALWAWKAILPTSASEMSRVLLASAPTPEQTEGPFYIERQLFRKNITEGKVGVLVELNIRLLDSTTGAPVAMAAVDVWHCDPAGKYSGFAQLGELGPPPGAPPFHHQLAFGPQDNFAGHFTLGTNFHAFHPGGPPHKLTPTDTTTFLRGTQLTDATGTAQFKTIYPGWYNGRALHIHFKVHTGGKILYANDGSKLSKFSKIAGYSGGLISHTGQLFFPEKISDAVSHLDPYDHVTSNRMSLEEDMIYANQGGKACMARVVAMNKNNGIAGYSASLQVILDPASTPDPE